MAVFSVQH